MIPSSKPQRNEQGLIMRFLPSFLTKKILGLKSHDTKPQSKTDSNTKLLQHLKEIPLSVFVDCLCEQDYSGLIKQGNPSKQDLEGHFEQIYEKYVEAVGGKELLRHIRQIKDLAIAQNRVITAEYIIETFKMYPTVGLYEQLYTFGYPLPKKPYNYENICDVLRIFVSHYKLDSRKLDRLLLEFEATKTAGEKSSGGYTREYFIGSLFDMSAAFKLNLHINNIMTDEYCVYINRYKQYCEMEERKLRNKQNG